MKPKSGEERLERFRENGKLITRIRKEVVTLIEQSGDLPAADKLAEKLMREAGGEPAFQRVPGYRYATCISVNEQIVHAIPRGKVEAGDMVTVDLGMFYQGTTTDMATSFVIGGANKEQAVFLETGKRALRKAIAKAKAGNPVRELSQAMQQVIEKAGYTVSRNLTGHGLGDTMHEEPSIPCFVSSDPKLRYKLKDGMVLAVEIMYMMGDWPLSLSNDGWTLSTRDKSPAAVFEEDVIVTDKGPEVITDEKSLEPGGNVW